MHVFNFSVKNFREGSFHIMDFLFKDRGSGKRAIKPSKEAEHLEALIPEHESDDSDFELDKHKGENSDHESDSDAGKTESDNESSSDSDESENDSVDEEEVLKLKSNMTTQELINLAQRQNGSSSTTEVVSKEKICGACLRSNRFIRIPSTKSLLAYIFYKVITAMR